MNDECNELVSGRTLKGYIDFYFDGNRSAFARHMGATPQQVTKWINGEWIVINHHLYSPRREGSVPENITGGGSAGN
ncbi:hypothetical protein ABQ313_21070 [Serratia fonticola]|uniref:hypothetical protein n=1 Tax=Serratia fonticola TaxID=47917 RepID=UPI003AAC8AEA|nr:hypothetical protein [Serratia fonticola]